MDDTSLLSRRDKYAFILEQCWPVVGWQLHKAKSPGDVQRAFQSIKGVDFSDLKAFVSAEKLPTTGEELPRLRKRIEMQGDQLRALYLDQGEKRKSLEDARLAIPIVENSPELSRYEETLQRREQRYREVETRIAELLSLRNSLDKELQMREAHFAQNGILEFVKSSRYSMTPERVANAMAGLPLIGWRHSAQRCGKQRTSHYVAFERFLVIQRVFRFRPRTFKSALAKMQTYLAESREKNQPCCVEMRSNWYYLMCAIEGAIEANVTSKEFPFRVAALYEMNLANQTPEKRVLQEEYRLDLPMPRRSAITKRKG
ncbi:MAG TPA: hypothetical protein VN622_08485 [Clostridia bacterium]|nr:hypothetical protein [Clostridia bacterium]